MNLFKQPAKLENKICLSAFGEKCGCKKFCDLLLKGFLFKAPHLGEGVSGGSQITFPEHSQDSAPMHCSGQQRACGSWGLRLTPVSDTGSGACGIDIGCCNSLSKDT